MFSGISLMDIWTIDLFRVAGTTVTLRDVFIFIIALIIAVVIARWVRNLMKVALKRRGFDQKEIHPVIKLTYYTLLVFGIYVAFNVIGIPLTGLLAAAGIVGIILGFGLQSITANMISGILLMGEGTVRIGDVIELDDVIGEVYDTGMRSTTIRTRDNFFVVVPNQELFTRSFTNYTYVEEKVRMDVSVGVAYGSDVEKVTDILYEVARETDGVLDTPEPTVRFREFAGSSLDFVIKCWVRGPFERRTVRSQMNYMIDERFREEGITIPFPQRSVWFKNELKQRGGDGEEPA
ncbi:mechanosensitive ion channel family protein [Methanonatronarchaeum sp. AMET6-2]|uniref:mechanosensitive ion channel family protein n=1 Tax=Methanonatronarchaeum sp. AMET6-2 TaxID=2933293 RepID=UPI0012155ACD|nr:mechanosensitive ion channel domain-containing protein [Methanonatronarchaeum sp. AMET6-2]RZN62047.1 MAG: mechanosensitive ion channel [Methanonatronarchaeia archaeon]UOY10370.1 mechanosensitive ion channel [Methanonatronarchaeum sp. AMET6-2]